MLFADNDNHCYYNLEQDTEDEMLIISSYIRNSPRLPRPENRLVPSDFKSPSINKQKLRAMWIVEWLKMQAFKWKET
jgi:hypothetical protein